MTTSTDLFIKISLAKVITTGNINTNASYLQRNVCTVGAHVRDQLGRHKQRL